MHIVKNKNLYPYFDSELSDRSLGSQDGSGRRGFSIEPSRIDVEKHSLKEK